MDAARKAQLGEEMKNLGRAFWSGEAEACRAFFSVPRTPEEHARWLRMQTYKELYGSGLSGSAKGIIRGILDQLQSDLEGVATREDRQEYERNLGFLREEFTHYRVFADALESIIREPVTLEAVKDWQLPQDRRLQEVRQHTRANEGRLGELAISFTEGGGSSLFYEGRKIGGTPIEDEIAAACDVVFDDEVEHSGHGAQMLQQALETEDEWATVRDLVTAICQQRIRMRYEMFGLPIPEDRIQQVTEGKIEILNIQA